MDRSKQLAEEKVSVLLVKFSVPAIIGMMVNALYNVVDRIFVGNAVGSLGIAGITISFPIMIISMAFAMLIGFGANSLISINLGAQKKSEAELILGNALVLLVVVSLAITIIGLAAVTPLLKLFGASSTVLPYARDYLRIILAGSVLMTIGFGLNNFIRAEGNPKIAMYTMVIGGLLNIIFDPIFIFLFDMGISGAAIATVLSQMISAVWVLYYFLSGNSLLKLYVDNLRLQASVVKKIVVIGSAPFAMQLAASLLNVIMNNGLSEYGGDTAVAGMGIINSILMIILMPVIGINQGAQPIIGFNYGAKNYPRVKETLKLAVTAATVIITVGFVFSRMFPQEIISLFNDNDEELIHFGTYALYVTFLLLPVIGFQIVGAGYFQAVGKPKQAMFLSLSRQVLILIPLLLILPRFYGLNGILYALPISDIISAAITVIWLFIEMKKLHNEQQWVAVEK